MTFHPAFVLLLGALLVPLFKGKARSLYVIGLPALAFFVVAYLPIGNFWNHSWLAGFGDLTFLRVDKLSKAFGYIFTINATAAFIYAFHVKDNSQHVSALLYIGSALGAVFAGDLISLYIFWEIMAVASTMLILARRTKRAYGSAFRYVLLHILGGLFFLSGIVITYHHSGSLAFDKFDPETMKHAGSWMILLGFLVNAAAPPFSAWLSDAYPEATVTGSVILSAYTTKTAVYTLIRGYPGWDILIAIGCAMAVYGIIYALLENDMRRILAYSIINQVGVMVCAVGIGTAICLDGAVAHAFCHIIYKSLLWMSAGAVLYRVGKSKCTDLGGLYKSMPWSLWLGCIGALAISAVPLTSGFTSKTMIIAGAGYEHLFWPWMILEIASAGVFLHAGIKFPYFVFFAKDRGHRVEEAPKAMIVGMAILAFFCIALGVYPQPLYNILPNHGAYEFSAWKFEKFVHQMQLLLLSALTFFVWIKWLKRTDTIVLDTDWFYRRGGSLFYELCNRVLNNLNRVAKAAVVDSGVKRLARFLQHGPARLVVAAMTPIWILRGTEGEELQHKQQAFYEDARWGAFPVGATAVCAVILLALLFLF
ncbi:MAG: Na(+)/H(+) antiporter subunit D [Verrucomicrobiaceae bacterium]|nr:Na(+)/H(+) antiporter subunit D [Verrucomicrobiaceae bacterium]